MRKDVVLAAHLGLVLLLASCQPAPRAEMARIIGPFRVTEGRLTGFQYKEFRPDSRLDAEQIAKLRVINRRLALETSPLWLADRGVLRLLLDNRERAISYLSQAVETSPGQASWLSDLSAVYLSGPRNPHYLLQALRISERAIQVDPALPEARFNRAIALQRLGLASEAVSTWKNYLQLDATSRWAMEAMGRRRVAEAFWKPERWEVKLLREAAAKEDRTTLERIVREFPQQARLYCEENLFRDWARATVKGDDRAASDILISIRGIGQALARSNYDLVLLDSVIAIDRVRESGAKRKWLADGYLAYYRGLGHIRANNFVAAGREFEKAKRELMRGGSPFALWAQLQLVNRNYLIGEPDRALKELYSLGVSTHRQSYRSLEARRKWIEGTSLVFLGRPFESTAAYQSSLALYEALGERGHAAAIHTRIASNLDFLGQPAKAWSHRLKALWAGVGEVRDFERLRVTYAETAMAVLTLGDARTALYFQEESVRLAHRLGGPAPLCTALRQRAIIRQRHRDDAGALRDLEEARRLARQLADPSARQITDYEILQADARIQRKREPKSALASLDAALRIGKDRFIVPLLRLERARTLKTLGDLPAAEADLEVALATLSRQRQQASPEQLPSYLNPERDILEELVRVQVANGKGASVSLATWEQARSRILQEWLAAFPRQAAAGRRETELPFDARSMETLVADLPTNITALEYLVQEDQTLIWIIRSGSVSLRVTPVGAAKLERQVRELIRLLNHGDPRSVPLASDLYKEIFSPLESLLPPHDSLVVMTDGILSALPFDILRNPSSGRYLIQDRVISTAPSLRIFSASLKRARFPLVISSSDVLSVAAHSFNRALFAKFRPLPNALQESQEIARIYGGAAQLRGKEATKARWLASVDRYEIIHFAGHALPNSTNPLHSMLLLAPDPKNLDSGVLYLHELIGKWFDRTRLIVLSACGTAAGPDSPVGGPISLATPFLMGGVPTVVATYWRVEDRAASQLLTNFHRRLAKGVPAASALRDAKLNALLSSDSYIRSPASWASFQLIGAPK